MNRIEAIRKVIPDCGLSTDIIAGYCSETEEDHRATLSIMQWAGFDFAFMFKYSERPNTIAEKKYPDDIPDEIKSSKFGNKKEAKKDIYFKILNYIKRMENEIFQ